MATEASTEIATLEPPWHQDEAFWDDRNHLRCNSLSVWMPLDDAVVESGCMQFLPGSHRNDVLRHRSQPGEPLFLDESVDLSTAAACPLPAGGATFHHCRTVHHTAANTSGRPRRAITTIFHGPADPRPEPLVKRWIAGLDAPRQLEVQRASRSGSAARSPLCGTEKRSPLLWPTCRRWTSSSDRSPRRDRGSWCWTSSRGGADSMPYGGRPRPRSRD